jgi:hypothetical protein
MVPVGTKNHSAASIRGHQGRGDDGRNTSGWTASGDSSTGIGLTWMGSAMDMIRCAHHFPEYECRSGRLEIPHGANELGPGGFRDQGKGREREGGEQ